MNAFDELVSRIKQVPIHRLGDVVAALDGKLEERGFSKQQLEQAGSLAAHGWDFGLRTAAERIMELPIDGDRVDAIEREIVRCALSRANGNKSLAARLAGMERKAFARRLEKYKVK